MQEEILIPESDKRLIRRNKIRKELTGWGFIFPSLILLSIFTFYPIVQSIIFAFMNRFDGFTYDGFGIQNFVEVFV